MSRTIYFLKRKEAIGRLGRESPAAGRSVLVALLPQDEGHPRLGLPLLLLLVNQNVVVVGFYFDLVVVVWDGIVVVVVTDQRTRTKAAARFEGIGRRPVCLSARPRDCLVSVEARVVCWRKSLRIDPSSLLVMCMDAVRCYWHSILDGAQRM